MIPKLSAPLTKAIRTSEGIAFWALNLVIGATAATGHLPAQEAATVASINTFAHGALRTGLKAAAVQKGLGIGAPIAPSGTLKHVLSEIAAPAEHVARQVEQDLGHGVSAQQAISQVVTDAEEFASQPGTAPAAPAQPAAAAPAGI